MRKYIFILFLTGCSIRSYPPTHQSKFDYSEYITYDCPHNSEALNTKCQTNQAE